MLFDSVFVKSILKDLIVFNVLIIELSTPLYFCDTEGSWVDCIHNLAINGSCCALLDFGKLKLQNHLNKERYTYIKKLVHPFEDNTFAYKKGALHHSDCISRHFVLISNFNNY